MTQHGQSTRTRISTIPAAFGEQEKHSRQPPPWAAHGVHHGPWWWLHTSPLAPGCFDFFAAFRLPMRFFRFWLFFLSLKEHVSRPNSIPFYSDSHSHRIARTRLEREFEREEEDLQSDGGSSKNRKIKRSHLTKHFFLFLSLLFSQLEFMISRLISFVLSMCFELVVLILDLYKF